MHAQDLPAAHCTPGAGQLMIHERVLPCAHFTSTLMPWVHHMVLSGMLHSWVTFQIYLSRLLACHLIKSMPCARTQCGSRSKAVLMTLPCYQSSWRQQETPQSSQEGIYASAPLSSASL